MPKAYGYTRYSAAKMDGDESKLVDAHKERIQRYCHYRLNEHEFAGTFVDRATSGSIPFGEREAGRQLSDQLKRGDHIVFATLDRGFRNVVDFLLTVNVWRDIKVNFHLLDLNVDSTSAAGEMVLTVLAAMAQFERRRASERAIECKVVAKGRGLKYGCLKIPGFRWHGQGMGSLLRPEPKEQPVVDRIWRLRDGGWGWARMWRKFLYEGLRTADGRDWTIERIRRTCVFKELIARRVELGIPDDLGALAIHFSKNGEPLTIPSDGNEQSSNESDNPLSGDPDWLARLGIAAPPGHSLRPSGEIRRNRNRTKGARDPGRHPIQAVDQTPGTDDQAS